MVLDDQEYEAIREVAAGDGLTVSEWVRRTLLSARRSRPEGARARKLAAVRAATSHDFPTADVDRMLEEIERGYVG